MHNIMTIEEVSEYLRVSERTVYDWVQKGEIPGGKLGNTWRFKRSEIERWVDGRLSSPTASKPSRGFTTSSLLTSERIKILDRGLKDEVLTTLVGILSETPFIRDYDDLLQGIINREKLMSTGIGFGVAVPHVRLESITDLVMAVAVCRNAVQDYESLDGVPVQIVCMVAARANQHAEYIRTLSSISSYLKEPENRSRLINADEPEAVYSLLCSGKRVDHA